MPTRCTSCQSIHLRVGSILCRRCGHQIDAIADPAAPVCYRCGEPDAGGPCSLCGGTRMVPANERFDDKHAATMNPDWPDRRLELECPNCRYTPEVQVPEPFCSVCGHDFVRRIVYG